MSRVNTIVHRARCTVALSALVISVHGARSTAHAVEVKPVVNAQVLGGQYYYKGSESAFGAMASVAASPYMKFNDQWSLVPLYSGNYRGTKQVADLIGGGTLFQDSQDHTVSSKFIRSFESGWKLKGVGSYGRELLRETKDENWGSGLYDNRRLSGGAEVEYGFGQDQSVRLAYDYYTIRFPNYQSLESQQSAGLGRELSQPNVLDNNNHAVSVGSQLGVPGDGLLELSASYTFRRYKEAHLPDISGNLTGALRHDRLQTLGIQGTWPLKTSDRLRLYTTLGYTWSHLYSNQNHYDAAATTFNPNYYAYITHSVSSEWTMLLGAAPWSLHMKGTLAQQRYNDRLIQDSSGVYGVDRTKVDSASLAFTVGYPIAKGFTLEATSAYGWNDSNNTYNALYQYHYTTATYLMGFRYAY